MMRTKIQRLLDVFTSVVIKHIIADVGEESDRQARIALTLLSKFCEMNLHAFTDVTSTLLARKAVIDGLKYWCDIDDSYDFDDLACELLACYNYEMQVDVGAN